MFPSPQTSRKEPQNNSKQALCGQSGRFELCFLLPKPPGRSHRITPNKHFEAKVAVWSYISFSPNLPEGAAEKLQTGTLKPRWPFGVTFPSAQTSWREPQNNSIQALWSQSGRLELYIFLPKPPGRSRRITPNKHFEAKVDIWSYFTLPKPPERSRRPTSRTALGSQKRFCWRSFRKSAKI